MKEERKELLDGIVLIISDIESTLKIRIEEEDNDLYDEIIVEILIVKSLVKMLRNKNLA